VQDDFVSPAAKVKSKTILGDLSAGDFDIPAMPTFIQAQRLA